MPEVVTKYPDIVIEILNDVPVIHCGSNVPPKILKQCPPEQFCSLPTGELCVYDLQDMSKMTQIGGTQPKAVKTKTKNKVKHNFYLKVDLPANINNCQLLKIMETTKSEYDGWDTGTEVSNSGEMNWEGTITYYFFLEKYNDIKKVINPIREKIKPISIQMTDFTEDPIIQYKIAI